MTSRASRRGEEPPPQTPHTKLDRAAWRNFGLAMLALSFALGLALFSAAVAQQGRALAAAIAGAMALSLAGWVAVTIVPALARGSSLRWLAYQVDYRLTREGIVYLAAVFVLILAAVNTGNNLLYLLLACLLAGILISGVLSRAVLTGIELRFDLPEHIFAGQPVICELELRNEKEIWPSLSLRVIGEARAEAGRGHADETQGTKRRKRPRRRWRLWPSRRRKDGGARNPGEQTSAILSKPVFFVYIPHRSAARQKVELIFPRRGVYRQDAFGIRTRFPFGFLEKTRRVPSKMEIVAYPRVEPADDLFELLPLLSGEMVSFYRGRGFELHSLRQYLPGDGARSVDWKVSARAGRMMVREFAREDERRLLLVLDPFVPASGENHVQPDGDRAGVANPMAAAGDSRDMGEPFERAVTLAASIAWHFYEANAVMQVRTPSFATPMAPAGEIIYDALREFAGMQPRFASPQSASAAQGDADPGSGFLAALASEREIFKIILTFRSQGAIPAALWNSSYVMFMGSGA